MKLHKRYVKRNSKLYTNLIVSISSTIILYAITLLSILALIKFSLILLIVRSGYIISSPVLNTRILYSGYWLRLKHGLAITTTGSLVYIIVIFFTHINIVPNYLILLEWIISSLLISLTTLYFAGASPHVSCSSKTIKSTAPPSIEAIESKVILITGAGGSIGSELCRQILAHNPKGIILIDNNENYLFELCEDLKHITNNNEIDISYYLTNILDVEKMDSIFSVHKPDIVFHTAAYKHVPMVEKHKIEAANNNIIGTKIVADLSNKYNVDNFVFISTDKSVNPTSFMGVTKKIAEMYVRSLEKISRCSFIIVRFGNVLNSKGSVMPLFRKQLARGGPITITHPKMERYFMTISEAANLILTAPSVGKSGDILLLDMGKPVNILDIVRRLLKEDNRAKDDINIIFVGMRPGEKLYEDLLSEDEEVIATKEGKINIIRGTDVDIHSLSREIDELKAMIKERDEKEILLKCKKILPSYKPWPAKKTQAYI